MKKDRYVDIITGLVLGVTVGVLFPLTQHVNLLILASVIVGVRLMLAAK